MRNNARKLLDDDNLCQLICYLQFPLLDFHLTFLLRPQVTPQFRAGDKVKCDLRTVFEEMVDFSCGKVQCPELPISGPLQRDITENLIEPAPKDVNTGVRVDATPIQNVEVPGQAEIQELKIPVDASVQVNYRDLIPHTDASAQVTSGACYIPFSSRITTDHQLSTLCGIRNHQILDRLVLEIDEIYPDKKKHKMTLRDRIIMTMMKLKSDLKFSCLAIIFNCVAESTCRAIFGDTIKKLAKVLKAAIRWVPKEEILRNMPLCFRDFQDTVCVVDCTEFKMQAPKCLACRLKVYSQYKSSFTVKYMTAVSPGGLLSYVSEGFGGRSTDNAIFEHSNIIHRLQPGDAVMADKGFRIDDLCHKYQIKLYRPPFLQNKKQFSVAEALSNRRIAAARVHVERMNQRIETFDVLQNKIAWNLVNYVDDIVVVCCGLANLGTPILADDKFL